MEEETVSAADVSWQLQVYKDNAHQQNKVVESHASKIYNIGLQLRNDVKKLDSKIVEGGVALSKQMDEKFQSLSSQVKEIKDAISTVTNPPAAPPAPAPAPTSSPVAPTSESKTSEELLQKMQAAFDAMQQMQATFDAKMQQMQAIFDAKMLQVQTEMTSIARTKRKAPEVPTAATNSSLKDSGKTVNTKKEKRKKPRSDDFNSKLVAKWSTEVEDASPLAFLVSEFTSAYKGKPKIVKDTLRRKVKKFLEESDLKFDVVVSVEQVVKELAAICK